MQITKKDWSSGQLVVEGKIQQQKMGKEFEESLEEAGFYRDRRDKKKGYKMYTSGNSMLHNFGTHTLFISKHPIDGGSHAVEYHHQKEF